jgi:1,4-alpha-glucan branching enzyme
MVEKSRLGGGKVRVTFRLPSLEDVGALHVCGDFNGWSVNANPLLRASDGTWSGAVTLKAGATYRFRYLDDHGAWRDDPDADGYEPNGYGGTNSLVRL